jgi:hypothetical protein
MSASMRPHGRFLIAQATTMAVLCAVTGLITLMSMYFQGDNHDEKLIERREAINRNDFWRQLDGAPLKLHTKRGQLARDLRPFLSSDLVESSKNSKLIPKSLKEISVDSEQYVDLGHEVGSDYVFAYNSESSCTDCGKFSPQFLGSFEQVRSGRLSEVIEPVPPKPVLHYTATFLAWPTIPYLIGLFLLFSTVSFVMAIITNPSGAVIHVGDYHNSKRIHPNIGRDWHFNGTDSSYKLASILLAFPLFVVWYVVRVPVGGFTGVANMVERITHRRTEREKMAEHPFAAELQRSYANRQRLQTMPETPEVRKAIKDTNALIEELESVPTNLSKRAAKMLAQDILRENAELRDRPKALLEAQDEIL